MGFLTDIITAGATIFGGPALGAAATAILGGPEPAAQTPAQQATSQGASPTIMAGAAGIVRMIRGTGTVEVGKPTGRMKNVVQTIVQTIAPDGKLVRQETLEGAPWLMRKDFVVMKRVLRTLAAGEKRVPRKSTGTPGKDKALAKAQGMLQAFMALGAGRPQIVNVDND